MKKKYISLLIILITAYLVVNTLLEISHSDNEIDRLSQLLLPAKKKITPASIIGFDTNVAGDRRLEVYFKTVLVMAPSLTVREDGHDTLLAVSDLSIPLKEYDKYRCIEKGQKDGLAYSLMVLK